MELTAHERKIIIHALEEWSERAELREQHYEEVDKDEPVFESHDDYKALLQKLSQENTNEAK